MQQVFLGKIDFLIEHPVSKSNVFHNIFLCVDEDFTPNNQSGVPCEHHHPSPPVNTAAIGNHELDNGLSRHFDELYFLIRIHVTSSILFG
jgi:hypothetical protein